VFTEGDWCSCDPMGVVDIRAFKVCFRDIGKLELRGFSFAVGEQLLHDARAEGFGGVSTDWVSSFFTLQTHPRSCIHDST